MMVGGAITVTDAFAVLPVPAVVSLTVTLLFVAPALVPWTFNPTVQLAPGARLELARETEPEPAAAVAVPVQLLVKPLGVATTRPAGRVSVKVMPLSV